MSGIKFGFTSQTNAILLGLRMTRRETNISKNIKQVKDIEREADRSASDIICLDMSSNQFVCLLCKYVELSIYQIEILRFFQSVHKLDTTCCSKQRLERIPKLHLLITKTQEN